MEQRRAGRVKNMIGEGGERLGPTRQRLGQRPDTKGETSDHFRIRFRRKEESTERRIQTGNSTLHERWVPTRDKNILFIGVDSTDFHETKKMRSGR